MNLCENLKSVTCRFISILPHFHSIYGVKATANPILMLIIKHQNTVVPTVKKETKIGLQSARKLLLFNGPLVIVRGIWRPTMCNVEIELWFTS